MKDDTDDDRQPRHWGDMGALVLAGGFSLFGVYLALDMLFGGHPLAALFRPPPGPPPRPLTQAEWNAKQFATAPGEVIISTNSVRPAMDTFPPIGDWSSLRIRLERTACFGTCPVYSVEISGDGSVVYDGVDCVAGKGRRTAAISRDAVKGLVARFRAAGYFALRDSYRAGVTDLPTAITSIAFDTSRKTVLDYGGAMVGMSPAVGRLEAAVDAAAGAERWISAGARTCGGRPVR